MKVIAWLAGIGTLLGAGMYMIVSLNRWEWNRALFFGLIVVIAEIGLATGLVLRRLTRLEHRAEVDPEIAEIFRTDATTVTGPVRVDAEVDVQLQRVHHVHRRRRPHPVGDRLDRRPRRGTDIDAGR